MKRHAHQLKNTILAGWLLSAFAILAVAILIEPQSGNVGRFWLGVAWMEFLCLLVWAASGLFVYAPHLDRHSTSRVGGIAPSLTLIVVGYAAMSFSAMLIASSNAGAERVHAAAQIILFAVAALTTVGVSASRLGALTGHPRHGAGTVSPRELHDQLMLVEHSQSVANTRELRLAVKALRESILYSLHDSAWLRQAPDYTRLCQRAMDLPHEVVELRKDQEADPDRTSSIFETLQSLHECVQHLSSRQVRE